MSNTTDPAVPGLLSDDPRDGTNERPDELDRQVYANQLAGLLDSVRAQSESTVLALIGDWGSGKSSVLEMLQQKMKDPWLVANFNPWTYTDAPSLHRGFFGELISALPEEDRPSNARTKIGEFARAISPLGKIGSLVGLDLEELIRAGGDLITGDASASAAKKAADSALRQVKRPILMVVDDLDRLTPDELLEVLKLVRLVGRLPHVYYLLSYDERTLLDVLLRTPVTGDDEGRARAYLEKIVQVRLDMPALRAVQRAKLLNDGLDRIGASVGLLLSEADEQRLSDIYFKVLDRRLSTPRAITRFLGQIQAFYPLLHGEVDFVDFFLVNWLRTQEPGVYRMLQTERDDVLGRNFSSFGFRRTEADQLKRRDRWNGHFQDARVRDADLPGVIKVLSALFPEIAAAFTEAQHFVESRHRSTLRAISDADYFDRYVNFGVTPEDVSDADFNRAIRDLATGQQSPAVERLQLEIIGQTARTMRKLGALRETGEPLPEVQLFAMLARAATEVDRRRNYLFDNPWRSAVLGGKTCLASMGSASAAEVVTSLGSDVRLEEFVIAATAYLQPDDSNTGVSMPPAEYDFMAVANAASAVLTSARENSSASSPLDDSAMTSFWDWRKLDPIAATAWVVSQVDTNRWTLADTMGAFTSTLVAIGGTNPDPRIGDFQIDAVDEIFTLDRVFTDLSPEIDSAEPPGYELNRVPATSQNRVQHALFTLKQERNRRSGV